MDIDGAVVDLDGTVYRGERLLPGAADAIRQLRDAGVRVLFVSNNPTKSRQEYAAHLGELGIDVEPADVLSSGTVTTRFLAEHHADDGVFLVGSDGLRRQLLAGDVELVSDSTSADVLVASWTREFHYDDMLAGYRGLAAGARFYGTDPDMLVPAAEGMVPGSGAILNAVGGPAGREPERVFGKPSPETRREVLSALDVRPERCLVVGDRLDTDIALGAGAGMTTALVRTGVATDEDVEESAVTPDFVVDSLAELQSVLV